MVQFGPRKMRYYYIVVSALVVGLVARTDSRAVSYSAYSQSDNDTRTCCSFAHQNPPLSTASTPQTSSYAPYLNAVVQFMLSEVVKLRKLLDVASSIGIFRCIAEATKHQVPSLRHQRQQQLARSWLSTKVYYVPLYFGIYFTIYIGYLILKAISRHKIQIPATAASSFLLFARNYDQSFDFDRWF